MINNNSIFYILLTKFRRLGVEKYKRVRPFPNCYYEKKEAIMRTTVSIVT